MRSFVLSAPFIIGSLRLAFALPTGVAGGPPSSHEASNQQCPTDLTFCGIGCYDIISDPNNCGGCNIVCSADSACVGGNCVPNNLGGVNGLIELNAYTPCYLSLSISGPQCGPQSSATTFTVVPGNTGLQSIQVTGEDSYIQVYLQPGQSALTATSNNLASLSLASSPTSASASSPTLGGGVYYETAVFSVASNGAISGTWLQSGIEYAITWAQAEGQGLLATAAWDNLRDPVLGTVTLSFVPT